MTRYLKLFSKMKQVKILALIVIALFALLLVSCVPGGAPPARGWSGTAVQDGILYTGSVDGRVVAIDLETRGEEWSYAITVPPPTTIYSTPIVDGDLVYIASYSGKVLALNTLARSQNLPFPQSRYGEWEWDCPGAKVGNNAIVADLLVTEDAIYVSSSNGRVYSLDKEFGDVNWESDILHEKLWTSPVIQGGTLYVSTFDGHIYALSAETGALLPWFFKSKAGFASSPVLYNDTIFVGSFDRNLYAIKIGDDEPLWKFPGGKWFWAAPLVNEGVVYAGCLDGKIYAIEAEAGGKLWEFDAGNPVVSSPVLMDNLLIVADESGTVYAFDLSADPEDRAVVPLRPISINAAVKGSLWAQEGLVFIRGQDNKIYVLDIERGRLSWEFPLDY